MTNRFLVFLPSSFRPNRKVTEDTEFVLYGVTLFKRIYSDFKTAAREKKFVVRDFNFDESEIAKERSERDTLGQDVRKQTATLTRWLKTTFSEAFIAWMHIKALRTFVESVLRFGLPINFVAMTILVRGKKEWEDRGGKEWEKRGRRRSRDTIVVLWWHLFIFFLF